MEQEPNTSTERWRWLLSGSQECAEQTSFGCGAGFGMDPGAHSSLFLPGDASFDRPGAKTRCFSGSCGDATATGSLRFPPARPVAVRIEEGSTKAPRQPCAAVPAGVWGQKGPERGGHGLTDSPSASRGRLVQRSDKEWVERSEIGAGGGSRAPRGAL